MAYWLCQLLGWGINAASQTYSAVMNDVPASTLQLAVQATSLNALALVLTHLLRDYVKRHRWQTLSIGALLPRVLLVAPVLGFPIALIMRFASRVSS